MWNKEWKKGVDYPSWGNTREPTGKYGGNTSETF